VDNGTRDTALGGGAGSGADARWRYLRGEVDRQLGLFGHRRRRDKRKAFALQMATVTLSATVTVLVGLRTSDATRTWLLNIALVLGALITVLAAAEAFFTHRRLWVLRTATVRRLEALSRHVDFHATAGDGPVDPRALAECLSELDAIIADDQQAWQHLHETLPPARDIDLAAAADSPPLRTAPREADGSV
jgi:hypothetical protein